LNELLSKERILWSKVVSHQHDDAPVSPSVIKLPSTHSSSCHPRFQHFVLLLLLLVVVVVVVVVLVILLLFQHQ
jgi:hypothetical protein